MEDSKKFFSVYRSTYKFIGCHANRNIGAYRGEIFGKSYLFGILLDFLFQSAFQFFSAFKKILHRTEFVYKSYGCLFAYAGASRYIVDFVTHKGKQVYDLRCAFYAVASAYLFLSADLEILTSIRRFVLQHIWTDKLTVVLVRSHHICGEIFLFGHLGERAYHVVGFITFDFHYGYVISLYYLLYEWYGEFYILRSLGSL